MAKVGMEYVVSAKLTEAQDGTPSYAGGRYWGPSSSFSMTSNTNDVKDYGDDRVVETDKTVNNYTVSIELNELSLELEAEILGHTYSSENKSMKISNQDVAPFIGLGCIGKSRRNNKNVYKGIWVFKAQVADPSDEYTTKQENTTFNHVSLEGTAFALANGDMVDKQEFDTLEAAKAWLNTKANIVG